MDVGNVCFCDGNGCMKEYTVSQVIPSSVKVVGIALTIASLDAFGNGINAAVTPSFTSTQKDPLTIFACFVGAVGVGLVLRADGV